MPFLMFEGLDKWEENEFFAWDLKNTTLRVWREIKWKCGICHLYPHFLSSPSDYMGKIVFTNILYFSLLIFSIIHTSEEQF